MALDLTPVTGRGTSFDPPAQRRRASRERAASLACVGVAAVTVTALVAHRGVAWLAPLVLLVVGARLVLPGRQARLVLAVSAAAVLLAAVPGWGSPLPPEVAAAVAAALMLIAALDLQRHGLGGAASAVMLADLRDQLRHHGRVPELPRGWHAESSIRTARDVPFGGDFLVSQREGDVLDLLLVDVMGKGMDTGARAVTLASAFAGLMTNTADAQTLMPAANRFVARECGPDLLATAVHVRLDLASGWYTLANAGHPAVMHFQSGPGTWEPLDHVGGVMLGVLEPELASFGFVEGHLDHGDALLLYSDGVVEDRRLGLDGGLDRMLGAAQREVARPSNGAAERICAAAPAGSSDDRSVVLVRRD